MPEHELALAHLQTKDRAPRVLVFAGPGTQSGQRPVSLAAAKRLRFVQNLKSNYQRLKEAMDFVEHFAVICDVSEPKIQAIREAKDNVLSELSVKFDEKLKAYDARIAGDQP